MPIAENDFAAMIPFAYGVPFDRVEKDAGILQTLYGLLRKFYARKPGNEMQTRCVTVDVELVGEVRRQRGDKRLSSFPVDFSHLHDMLFQVSFFNNTKLVSKLKNSISLLDTQSYNVNRGYTKTSNYVLPRSSPDREKHTPRTKRDIQRYVCVITWFSFKGEGSDEKVYYGFCIDVHDYSSGCSLRWQLWQQ